jgi:hypothetical protein
MLNYGQRDNGTLRRLRPTCSAALCWSAIGAVSAPAAAGVSIHTPIPGPRSMPSPACSTPKACVATRIGQYDGPGESKGEGFLSRSHHDAARPGPPILSPKTLSPAPQTAPVLQAMIQLHTADGAQKYLTASERDAFLRAAEWADRAVRTLCMTLAYAGCRLSEALALTTDRVDLAPDVLVFESLKKRRTCVYPAVPVPPALLDALDLVHGIRELQSGHGARLWPRLSCCSLEGLPHFV